MVTNNYTQLGYQQITSLSSATGLTVPAGTRLAVINVESQPTRYRDDGTDPTASVGMPLGIGSTLFYDGSMNKIKFIETVSGAKLNVLYYG